MADLLKWEGYLANGLEPSFRIMKCYCYRRIPSVNATVQCQYAARISDKNTKGENFLGLMCYEKRSELPEKIMDPRVMCEKWRYPGLEYPRLQVPDYLKSTDARPVVYNPPQVEDRKFSCRYCDSWPKNQKERTGFGGIGDLNNLGPNHVLYLIVTSGPANDSEIILIGNGENATLPKACYLSEGSQVDYYFMGDRVKALSKEIGGCPQSELWHVVKGLKEVHSGYLKDRRNTDNAWMDGIIVHLHDQAGHCFGSKSSRAAQAKGVYSWVSMKARNETIDSYVSPLIANYK
ncbi:hypothetical protein M513_09873 [Trichuris suis]|uniref:Uncharacterized protein n=1 Tax=Trichuris suis TaxID=68888 RepID=A0A085LW76_9BILA|nr:hypothetical protein M513_09873 [Trichuris suis]